MTQVPEHYDAVVVGAGFAGLYLLHRLRRLGFSVVVLEAADDVGGTWYWNRYPGARCDVESLQYSYSFSEELQQEWVWTERYATQPEILSYLNHVADRFDLRRDIRFETRVVSAKLDDATNRWVVSTDRGDHISATFCFMATGSLSAANVPAIKGLDTFEGEIYHTGDWPHQPIDFTGLKVGVVGTGSSGVQCIPEIARQSSHLTVFQRTPQYTIPARNKPLSENDLAEWKANYAERRAKARQTRIGVIYHESNRSVYDATEDERMAEFDRHWEGDLGFLTAFNDLTTSVEADAFAADYVRAKIRKIVHDPKTAQALTPSHPMGSRRIIRDSGYYDMFNRPDVTLVDVNADPIEEIVPQGIRTGDKVHELDRIVFATGFDAMTGALAKIDISGRGGLALRDKWDAGPRTYLGLMTAGFPNFFIMAGPGSPAVRSNVVSAIEHHVEWIADLLVHMREHDLSRIEPTLEAEDAWVAHVAEVAANSLFLKANSWYLGANIPGKPRVFMPYVGGFGRYVNICTEIAQDSYRGFSLTGVQAGG